MRKDVRKRSKDNGRFLDHVFLTS